MKASELIRKLQEQIELHGDYEVYFKSYDWDFDYGNSYPVNEVRDGYIHEYDDVESIEIPETMYMTIA